MTFAELEAHAHCDLAARQQIRKLEQIQKYALMGSKLEAEPKYLIDRFQLEPTDPETIGMNEALSDQFDPDELVRLMSRPPIAIDWDLLETVA